MNFIFQVWRQLRREVRVTIVIVLLEVILVGASLVNEALAARFPNDAVVFGYIHFMEKIAIFGGVGILLCELLVVSVMSALHRIAVLMNRYFP